MAQTHHRFLECHKCVPCFVLCPFPWNVPCFFQTPTWHSCRAYILKVSLLSGSNQFRYSYLFCKVTTRFLHTHHLAFIYSVLNLLFYCLITHNSLQMTLTPANLKRLCIVSKHSCLAAHHFLHGSDELWSTAQMPPCAQLLIDDGLCGYEIMHICAWQLMTAYLLIHGYQQPTNTRYY